MTSGTVTSAASRVSRDRPAVVHRGRPVRVGAAYRVVAGLAMTEAIIIGALGLGLLASGKRAS